MGEVSLIPTSKLVKKLGIDPNGQVQAYFTNRCQRYMDTYVPKRDGNLRRVIDLQTDRITYMSEYASYQYRGERLDGTHVVKNYTTPRNRAILG